MHALLNRLWRGAPALLLSFSFSIAPSPLAAQTPSWPMFRGPNATGQATGAAPPLRWNVDTGDRVAWKTAIPGIGHSSPIVWGDRIFVTTAVSSDATEMFDPAAARGSSVSGSRPHQTWQLLCLDRRTGDILWQRTVHRGEPRIGRHAKGSHANATAATDGEFVAAFFGSEGLYVFTVEGDLVWSRDLGVIDVGYVGQAQYQWGTASSPLLHDGMVVIQADAQRDSFIAAFDLRSGRERWRHSRDELPTWSTPVVARTAAGPVIVTNGARFMRGLDPATGRERWRVEDGAEVKVPTPVVGDEIVVMSGGAPRGRQFYGLTAGGRTGSSVDRVAWTANKGGPYTPTPIIVGNHLLVLSDNGVLSRYNLESGRLLDQTRVPASGYSASPIAVGRLLYLASEDGDIHVVSIGTDVTLVGTNPMREPLMATPAIADGMLIVRGARHLFGIADTSA